LHNCPSILALSPTQGGCEIDQKYTGPKLDSENGKHTITHQFIKDMIEWFKDGKTIPKRYVWEIVLGAYEHFAKDDSLVDVNLEAGVTCDVIGDVHGKHTTALQRIC
jgi:serine/threonine-protein phosphatase 5